MKRFDSTGLHTLGRMVLFLLALGVAVGAKALPPTSDYNACAPTWFGPGTCGAGSNCNGQPNTATYYSTTGMTACQYGQNSMPYATGYPPVVNTTLNANITNNNQQLYAAVNGDMFLANDLCGACALVVNQSGDAYNGNSVTVMITDECPSSGNPDCANGYEHLDLSPLAFQAIDGNSTTNGVIAIKWEMTPCPVGFFAQSNSTGNITYEFKSGSTTGWAPIILRDNVVPIAAVSFCTGNGSGCSAASWNNTYNGWLAGGGSGALPSNPFYLQVTDYAGKVTNLGPITCCSPDPGPNNTDPESTWTNIGGQMSGCGLQTPTDTSTPGPTATDSPNYTATPTPTPTATPADCPTTLWGASSTTTLTSNGSWNSTNSSLAVSTAEVQTPAQESLLVTTTTGAGTYMQTIANLTPLYQNWTNINGVDYGTGTGTLTMDVYMPAASLSAFSGGTNGYCQAGIDLTNSVISPDGGVYTALVAGWNHLTFTLGPATGLNYSNVNELLFILNCSAAAAEPFYICNIELHSNSACPTATPSPTDSRTYTATPTDTPTQASTFTSTASPTPTLTDTPTSTATATATATSSSTSTVTPVSSATDSSTVTGTSTPTPTSSPTATASDTHTSTATPSASDTFTPVPPNSTATDSYTVTATSTSTPSPTATASPTSTSTASPTFTAVPANSTKTDTATATATSTSTPTASSTGTATATPSSTPTATATPTGSATATATGTASSTVTPTSSYTVQAGATDTQTATDTSTSTPTPSFTATASPTASPTPGGAVITVPVSGSGSSSGGFTVTVQITNVINVQNVLNFYFVGINLNITVTATVSSGGTGLQLITATLPTLSPSQAASATGVQVNAVSASGAYVRAGTISLLKSASPTPANGPAQILSALPVPNPWTGPGSGRSSPTIAVDLAGEADDVVVKVYTKALFLVGSYDFGQQSGGWDQVALPSQVAALPDGLYYFTVTASRGGQSLAPTVGKLAILK